MTNPPTATSATASAPSSDAAATPPAPTVDHDSFPWWDGLRRHRLLIQRCDDCDTWRWTPRALCPHCGSFATTWTETSGRGRIASWIVNHHRFGPAFSTPYVVVTVRLDEQADVLLIGGWTADAHELALDLPVEAVFLDHHPDNAEPFTLLSWRPQPN